MARLRMRLFMRGNFTGSVGAAVGAGGLLFAACLPSYSFGGDGGAGDGGADGGSRDARADTRKSDAGHDGAGDSSRDASRDSTTDAPSDGHPDAARDAPKFDATSDATTDAPHDGPAVVPDASHDTSIDFPDAAPFDAPPVSATPFTVLASGASRLSMGFGEQTHVVHVQGDSSYWLFYAKAGAGTIGTLVMPDGTSTWTAASAVPLNRPINDGNSFSVAYARLGSTDVIHIVADDGPDDGTGAAFDIRATISGSTLSAGTPIMLPNSLGSDGSQIDCPNDGPAVSIASDGTVYEATGWLTHTSPQTECDTNIFQSKTADTGAAGPTMFSQTGYYVSQTDIDFSHELLAFGDAGVLAVWPDWDVTGSNGTSTSFDTFGWATAPFAGGTSFVGEAQPSELFYNAGATPPSSSYNDWAVCRLSDTDVHLVRHVLTDYASSVDTPFEEEVYNGSSWTASLTAPPSVTATFENGVVLVSKASASDEMLLVAIDQDNALDISLWKSGTWSAVGTVPSAGKVRSGLAGSGCGSPKAMVFWTEPAGATETILGVDLTSLLP